MAEGAKGTATDVYVLETGDAAAERLRLLDKVYGPATRQMLLDAGIKRAQRALDLACGIGSVCCWMATQVRPGGSVVAADVNPDQLVVAKWNCARCEHLPIEYIETSAYETGFPEASFDVVHIRFLLCHLTEPARVLREAHRVLRTGGALVCQDVKMSSIFCEPHSPAYARFIEAGLAAGASLGVDYDYGKRLPAAAMDAGFRSVEVRFDQPAYLRGPEKRLWEMTFAEASPEAVRTGRATQEELSALLEEMAQVAADEHTLIAQACMPSVIAIK
jgi:SAM-dependent methyltransferase